MLESKGLFPELEQVVSSHVDSGENSQCMTLLKSQLNKSYIHPIFILNHSFNIVGKVKVPHRKL